MRSRFVKIRGISLRLAVLMAIAFTSLIPVQLGADAQGNSAPIQVVRSLYTSEFGVNDPEGLAFSATANTFFVIDESGSISLVTMGEDNAGTQALYEVQDNALNVAFDKKSDSLFVFKRGNSELVKIKSNDKGLPDSSAFPSRFAANAYGIKDPQGIAFDPSGGMFILDAGNSQIVSVVPHATLGFDANEAIHSNKVQKLSLKKLGLGSLKGLAYNPGNGHLYVSEPAQKKLYELTQNGNIVSMFDLAPLGIINSTAMTFAPSVDSTDDPNIYDLFVLDDRQAPKTGLFSFTSTRRQSSASDAQIVELSLVAPMALPPGTTLLPASLVNIIDTSNAAWSPSAPDPSGVDYWPLTNRLVITDSEVEEMPNYYQGKNVYQSTTSGNLGATCSTAAYSGEPTGMAINPNNNHLFISDDNGSNDKVFEISLGQDGVYCTADDVVTTTNVAVLYGASDAEDVAYGNNTLFIGGGDDGEVFRIPLGADGVLGGGDDGAMTHFDTTVLGFSDMESLGYNADSNTLFLASPKPSERYLGETTPTGTLLRAYDLALMGSAGNIRSDVAYAPGSVNPGIKNIYIASRGVDNNDNQNENDGRIWEINIAGSGTSTPSRTPTNTNTPTATATGPTATRTSTPTFTPTFTSTSLPSGNTFYGSFGGNGTVGGVAFADEDIVQFNGSTWSLFFDGSDVGLGSVDLFGFYNLDADTILMSFNTSVTLGGVSYTANDIARFDATSLGATTAGTFSMYFNGIDVGLSGSAENIDALEVLPDGKVLISTTGNPVVTGVTGAADEDILAFTPTTLGTNTSGNWAMYFEGSDVGLDASTEDIDALDVDPNGVVYLSTTGLFSVTGVFGDDEDVFVCTPTSLGSVTACTFSPALYFDGSAWAQTSNDLDGFNLLNTGPFPTATPSTTPGPTNTPTFTLTPSNTPTPTNTATIGPSLTSTNTPTATNTSSVSDVIFADGFESGSLAGWTSNSNDAGDLSASAASALVGSQGMLALIDDTNSIYVNDDSPNSEPRYRVRFYFDPNSISMASNDAHFIFKGFMGTATDTLQLELRNSAGAYQVRAKLLNDSSVFMVTNWFTINDASHFIELDWRAATAAGANNGGLTLWIDGVQQADLTGVDNDTWRIDRARLGALSGMDLGTSGTYYFDAFESRRQTFIGP